MRHLLVLTFALFATSASAQSPSVMGPSVMGPSVMGPSVMGTWLTESGVGQVKIASCSDPAQGPICGTIVGLVNPKGPDGKVVAPDTVLDPHNENAALRSRKMIGVPLIWGFKKTSDPNAFEEGKIYNGEDGKTYTANISLQADGKLRLRGYVGSTMFGKTQLWTRISQ